MNTSHRYFVTGIGTDVGKTIVAAVFVQLLKADYWKPIQAGDLADSDSHKIERLAVSRYKIHPERYRLTVPVSPHQAAAHDDVRIRAEEIVMPQTDNHLVVEGAGGLFVPINEHQFLVDVIAMTKLPVILVVRDYLGCINHTLLSVKAIENAGISLAYIVFNGQFNIETKNIICRHLGQDTKIVEIPELTPIDSCSISKVADDINSKLKIYIEK